MIGGMFGSLTKGLFNTFTRDSALNEIRRNKQRDKIKKTIGILKNYTEYNARKKIRQNEVKLRDKLDFWGRLVVKGNNIIGPGLAEMKYIREHAGEEDTYIPESLPAYDFQSMCRLLNAIIPRLGTTLINQNYSTTDKIKYLTLGLALSNTPYSIPILSRVVRGINSHGKRSIWPYIIGGAAVIVGTALGYNHFLAPWSDSDNDGLDRETENNLKGKDVDVNPFRKDSVVAAGYKAGLPAEMLKVIDDLLDEPNSYLAIEKLANLPNNIVHDYRILPILDQMVEDNRMSDSDLQCLDNLDRDAFTNEEELYGPYSSFLDVFKPNPAVKYALDKGLDLDIVKQLRVLDGGGLDENEKEFIDDLHYIEHGLIPSNIRKYYWTDEEVKAIQQALFDSLQRCPLFSHPHADE